MSTPTATDVEPAPEIAARAAISGAGWIVAGLTTLAGGIPLATALAALHSPTWYAASDHAQTELRVRDVSGGHLPLIGLAGRIGGLAEQGSHPGPISFYALWPVYKLFGSSSWALLVAAAILSVAAMAVAIAIAYRRGGPVLAVAMAAAVAVLAQAYGPNKLVEPWNPFMPVLWWFVFLLALWSVLNDDLPLLPVAVVAGTFCMQTHVSYLGLAPSVAGVTVAAVAVRMWAKRRDPGAWRHLARWGIPATGLLVLLWLPPLAEQVTEDPGNLTLIRETFTNPNRPAVGFGWNAVEIWLAHLNLGDLVTGTQESISIAPDGPILPGLVLLAIWLPTAAMAWRRRTEAREVWTLHVVVAAALGLQLVSISTIRGQVADYLVLWAWGTTTLLVFATVWTWVSSRPRPLPQLRLGLAALAIVLVTASASLTVQSVDAKVPFEPDVQLIRGVGPATADALLDRDPDGTRYLLDWDRRLDFSGYGLLLELERHGLDVGAPEVQSEPVVPHRVRKAEDADVVLHYVGGPDEIERWHETPGAEEVRYFEPRDREQLREFDRLADEVAASLRDAGLSDLVPAIGVNSATIAFDARTPPEVLPKLERMTQLGTPVAVFATAGIGV